MILVGHKSRAIAGLIAHRTRAAGLDAVVVTDGLSVLERLSNKDIKLAVLDPSICGPSLDIIEQIRSEPTLRHTVLVIYGEEGSPEDQRVAASAGADLRLSKTRVSSKQLPCVLKELLAGRVPTRGSRCASTPAERESYKLHGQFRWSKPAWLDSEWMRAFLAATNLTRGARSTSGGS